MNNITTNFPSILAFAQNYQLPPEKKRAIILEYLQSLFISRLYALPKSDQLSFVGGTSLRLLRGLDRFSEDLYFDNLGLETSQIMDLISQVVESLARENIQIELNNVDRSEKTYFSIKFPELLFDLNISTNQKEKLMIKLDYADWWKGQITETILFNRFGFLEHIVTNTLDCLFVQKITAYVQRKQTQPRDLYDITWLFSQHARYNSEFAAKNGLDNILALAREKFKKEGVTTLMKNKLKPFLFTQRDISRLELVGEILEKI